jgi:hypothetical protein
MLFEQIAYILQTLLLGITSSSYQYPRDRSLAMAPRNIKEVGIELNNLQPKRSVPSSISPTSLTEHPSVNAQPSSAKSNPNGPSDSEMESSKSTTIPQKSKASLIAKFKHFFRKSDAKPSPDGSLETATGSKILPTLKNSISLSIAKFKDRFRQSDAEPNPDGSSQTATGSMTSPVTRFKERFQNLKSLYQMWSFRLWVVQSSSRSLKSTDLNWKAICAGGCVQVHSDKEPEIIEWAPNNLSLPPLKVWDIEESPELAVKWRKVENTCDILYGGVKDQLMALISEHTWLAKVQKKLYHMYLL